MMSMSAIAANNAYLAVSQLWVQASVQEPYAGFRRPDVILYVNGLPLVFIELKNSNVKLRSAFDDNLANYKHDIPQLFHCNVFCLLSNAIETKVGSFTAGWEHFFNWMRVERKRQVIVMVDEAHRTQYKSLAENMRAGLKGAHFLAFTGTPLLGKERKTNAWFGDYVSEYNFQQAMQDEATVPLFYEKRVPEVLIQNDDLGEEFYELLEDENLDEAQQQKLPRCAHSLKISYA